MVAGSVPLLSVEDLSVEFRTRDGVVRALERVGFSIGRGETVGIVGESGSGKSVTAFTVLGLLPPAARVTSGRAVFGGPDPLTPSPGQLPGYPGPELAMVFQSPGTPPTPTRPAA